MTRGADVQLAAVRRYQHWLAESIERGPSPKHWLTSGRELAHLGVTYYRSMSDYGHEVRQRVAAARGDEAFTPESAGHRDGGDGAGAEVVLSGSRGGQASAVVVLENKRSDPAEVSFLVSEFTGNDGSPPFRAVLETDPVRFRLGPLQELPVTLSVTLDPVRFSSGVVYRGTVVVKGYDHLQLDLAVHADAPGPTSTD